MKESKQVTAGITTPGLLLILFIALKLTGVVTWSWWWVLSPLWIPFAIVFGVMAIVAVAALIFGAKHEV